MLLVIELSVSVHQLGQLPPIWFPIPCGCGRKA